MYKILIDKAFTEDEDSPFKKIEKFNTQWGTLCNRDLVKFMKEEILEMCPKDVTDILMPRRDSENRHMVPPIIELEFEKDILDPHIIRGGESIQLGIRKTLCKRCLQFGHPEKCCRRDRELCTNCVEL